MVVAFLTLVSTAIFAAHILDALRNQAVDFPLSDTGETNTEELPAANLQTAGTTTYILSKLNQFWRRA